MAVHRGALAGSPPPRGPTHVQSSPRPTLLDKWGLAAFLLSGVVATVFAVSRWPRPTPLLLLAPAYSLVLLTLFVFATTFGFCMAWLARTTLLRVLAAMGLPLLLQALLNHSGHPWPWSGLMALLAIAYLTLAAAGAIATVARTWSASAV
jgi:hypothetical protein